LKQLKRGGIRRGGRPSTRTKNGRITPLLHAYAENQTANATITATITAHTTGVIFLVLPLRGELLAAWLNSVFNGSIRRLIFT
jgi:hypothetical protein